MIQLGQQDIQISSSLQTDSEDHADHLNLKQSLFTSWASYPSSKSILAQANKKEREAQATDQIENARKCMFITCFLPFEGQVPSRLRMKIRVHYIHFLKHTNYVGLSQLCNRRPSDAELCLVKCYSPIEWDFEKVQEFICPSLFPFLTYSQSKYESGVQELMSSFQFIFFILSIVTDVLRVIWPIFSFYQQCRYDFLSAIMPNVTKLGADNHTNRQLHVGCPKRLW